MILEFDGANWVVVRSHAPRRVVSDVGCRVYVGALGGDPVNAKLPPAARIDEIERPVVGRFRVFRIDPNSGEKGAELRHRARVSAAVVIEKVPDEWPTVTFRIAHESLREPVEMCFAGDDQVSEIPSLFEQAQKVRLGPLCRVCLVTQARRFELSFALPLSELDPADGFFALADSPESERPRPGPGMLDAFQLDAAQYEKVREFCRNSTSRLCTNGRAMRS
jgi:hypothetical protein